MDPAYEQAYWTVVAKIQAPLRGKAYVANSPGRGLGLFAARNLRAGERITTFYGVLIEPPLRCKPGARPWSPTTRCRAGPRREHRTYARCPRPPPARAGRGAVAAPLTQSLHVDGIRTVPPSPHVGLASFANDGRGPTAGRNNARFQNVLDAANQRLIPVCVLVATKAIPMHAEIMVSYGSTYWKRQTGDDDED